MQFVKLLGYIFISLVSISMAKAGQWEDYRNKLIEDTFKLKPEDVKNVQQKALSGDAYSTLLIIGCIENRPAIVADHEFEKKIPDLLVRDANTSNAVSKTMLGMFYLSGGWGLFEKNENKGMEWIRKGADAGDARALLIQAMPTISKKSKTKQEVDLAIKLVKSASTKGDSEAMLMLAQLAGDESFSVDIGSEQAINLIEQSAKLNNPESLFWVAYSYFTNVFKPQGLDDAKAIQYLEKASFLGNQKANQYLSELSKSGKYKKLGSDEILLKQYLDRGFSKPIANFFLGVCKIDTKLDGVDNNCEKNLSNGISLLKDSASKGELFSNWLLFNLYASGFSSIRPDQNLSLAYAIDTKKNLDKIYSKEYAEMGYINEGKKIELEIKKSLDNLLAEGGSLSPELMNQAKILAKNAPVIKWKTPPPSEISTEELFFDVEINDLGGGIGDVILKVDGVALGAEKNRNIALKGANPNIRSFNIKLSEGKHVLEVIAYNSENLINWNSVKTSINSTKTKVTKPKMYAVVVGINEYESDDLTLKFAKNDADVIAKLLQTKGGNLFESVNIILLNSKQKTTRKEILNAIEDASKKVSLDDVFVFYNAGHGVTFEYDGYYLLTSNVRMSSEEKIKAESISAEELQKAIYNVPSGKKVVLLDTCQSGGALDAKSLMRKRGGLDKVEMLSRFKRKSGAVIISAAESKENALEGYNNHGLFTYALIEAIEGKADANNDSYITTSELTEFVIDRASYLAEKVFKLKQSPTLSAVTNFEFVSVHR